MTAEEKRRAMIAEVLREIRGDHEASERIAM